jgi:hypothetical protein
MKSIVISVKGVDGTGSGCNNPGLATFSVLQR